MKRGPRVPDPALTRGPRSRAGSATAAAPGQKKVRSSMTDYTLTPSLRKLRSALAMVSVDPEHRTPTRNL